MDGELYVKTGSNRNHNIIVGNIGARLNSSLREQPCLVSMVDLRVYIPAKRSYFYPDVTVVCGEEHFTDPHNDTLLNPTVIIEVVSPSTENYDRTTKFEPYRQIPSLREYLLIAQNRVYVEHFVRQPDHQWLVKFYTDHEAVIALGSIQVSLMVDDVYSKVELDQQTDQSA